MNSHTMNRFSSGPAAMLTQPTLSRWIASLVCLMVLSMSATASAQRFDVERYLKKIDSNQNGMLESNEMNGRTRDFIGKMGFNTDRPVSIGKVVSKVNRDRSDREAAERKKNAPPLRVPGFGVEPTEKKPVLGFSNVSTGSSSSAASKPKYSESIMKQVDDALERYDRNKDGLLDAEEIKRGRWGNPSPKDSDKNRDGRLTRDELAQRYVDREGYYNRDRNRKSSSSRSSSRTDDLRERMAKREAFRSSGSSGARSSSMGSASSRRAGSGASASRASKKSSATDMKKYEDYAKGLIEQYDLNKSGALEKDEIAKMRRPPAADLDKDGTITKQELLDHLTRKSSGKPSAAPEKSAAPTSSSERRASGYRGSSKSRSSSRSYSGSFSDLDENKDGRVHMHEFSKQWDDEIVKKFNEKDQNGDGIISESEWRQ